MFYISYIVDLHEFDVMHVGILNLRLRNYYIYLKDHLYVVCIQTDGQIIFILGKQSHRINEHAESIIPL